MYIPSAFRVDDPALLNAFIHRHSFATLITSGEEPFITHLPLLLDVDNQGSRTLVGHFARANPHWQLDHVKRSSVAIFNGPHAYISPSWYCSGSPAVPTWNYAVVHAWGRLSLISEPGEVEAILRRLVEVYEPDSARPWESRLSREGLDKLVASVVAFRMPIDRVEGKFKLSQNRSAVDQIGAIGGLEASEDADSTALAAFARTHLRNAAQTE